jgi:hypothetical protein
LSTFSERDGADRHILGVVEPDDGQTHFEIGIAYLEMGLLGDALHEFELAVRIDPSHAGARAELERLRTRIGSPQSWGKA